MLTLTIVSDTRVYREGLTHALSSSSDFDVRGASPRSFEALVRINLRAPHLALVDMASRGGLRILTRIAAIAPMVTRIALAVSEEPREVLACAEAGAVGLLSRDASLADLRRMIGEVAEGRLSCSPTAARILFASARRRASAAEAPCVSALTRREQEILALIEQGLANKVIGRRLGIQEATVKNHVHNILGKLQVTRRGEAAALHRQALAGHAPL